MRDEKQRFSLRKLSVGLASVLIGITFLENGQIAKADTITDTSSQVKSAQAVGTGQANSNKETQSNNDNANKTSDTEAKLDTNTQVAEVAKSNNTQTSVQNNTPNKDTQVGAKSSALQTSTQNDTQADTTHENVLSQNPPQRVFNTNTLNLNRKTFVVISPNELSESKVTTQTIPNWNDPASQGYTKTSVGWTKRKIGDNGITQIADKASATLMKDYDQNTPQEHNQNYEIGNGWAGGIDIKGSIDASKLHNGDKVLIAAIPVLNSTEHAPQMSGNEDFFNHDLYIKDASGQRVLLGQVYGDTIPVNVPNGLGNGCQSEYDYYLSVGLDNDKLRKFVGNVDYEYKGQHFFVSNWWNTHYPDYKGMKDGDQNVTEMVMPDNGQDNTYTFTQTYNASSNATPTDLYIGENNATWSPSRHSIPSEMGSFNFYIADPSQSLPIKRVFKYQAVGTDGQPIDDMNLYPSDSLNYSVGYNIMSKDDTKYTHYTYGVIGNNFGTKTINAGDNLTANDLYNSTDVNQIKYSYNPSDKSYMVCVNLDGTKLNYSNLSQTYIHDLLGHSRPANMNYQAYGFDSRDELLQHQIDYYSQRNFQPIDIALYIPITNHNDAATIDYITDETPGTTSTTPIEVRRYIPNGTTINADTFRNTTVQYLDDDDNEIQVSADSLIGRKDTSTPYTINIPQGYVLSDNQDGTNYKWNADKKTINYTFQDDQKDNVANPIVIHLKHKHETINGEKDTQNKDVTIHHSRVIHYVYDNGRVAKPDDVQTVIFTRTADEDMATHQLSNFSNWAADGDYSQINVKHIIGYTPTQTVIPEMTASPDHDVTLTVIYNKNKQVIHVSYIDDTTGAILETKNLDGYSGDANNYTTTETINGYKSRGYELVSDSSNGQAQPFDSDDFADDQAITVHLKHGVAITNLNHDVTRTIHYVYVNGQKAKDDDSETLHFNGTQMLDKVTGQITSTKWDKESQNFGEVASPLIHGYTADQTLIRDVIATPTSDNIIQTVTYNPNKQNIHVVFIDDTTGNTLNSVEKSGYTDTDSGYSTQNDIDSLIAKGYKLVSDNTPKENPTLHFDSDDFTDDQNFTVHMAHDTKTNNLTKEVARTIHYVFRDGKPAGTDHQDSIEFNGVETIDKVTGNIIDTAWTPENKEFASVNTPILAGYTPDKFSVDSTVVKPDSDNQVVTITYSPDTQYAKFNYIDDTTGNQLKQETSHGVTDGRDNYSTANLISYYKSKGYDLVSDDTANKVLTFDSDDNSDQIYNIHFVHGTVIITPQNPGKPGEKINPQDPSSPVYPEGSDNLTRNVNREIDYVYEDGRVAEPSVKDSLTFNNTQKIDKVTGEVISSTWDGPKDFADIATPAVEGYTPDKTSVENKGINHATPSIKVTVTYSADPQHMAVIYRDLTDNRILSQMTKDGVSDEDSHYNTKLTIDGYVANGYVLSSDATNGKDLLFDHNDKLDQTYYVDFTHGSHQYNPEKPDAKDKVNKNDYLADYNTVISYVDSSNKKLMPDKTVTDEYQRDLTIDSVNGNIIKRGNWQLSKGYTLVENPVATGYITNSKSVKPTDMQKNQTISIVYQKLGQVHSVDNNGKEIARSFSYTNDPTDPTKVLVTKVPSVDGYEQVTFTVDPTKKPLDDTTVIFNAPSTVIVNYVDTNTGKTVHSDTVKGFATHTPDYSTKSEIDQLVDEGYVLTKDNVPTSIKLTEDPQNYTVTLVHGISKVTHDNPVKPDTPIKGTSQKMPKGVDENDLNRSITRRITVVDPHTGKKTTTQVAKLFRDATVDNVTGQVTYTAWNKATWDKFETPVVAGYTPSQNDVPEVQVTPSTKDNAVTITYTANPQTGKISYVDIDGREVANTPLNGKTDETVNVSPQIPHGWVVVDGQTIPASVVATANGIPTVSIKIKHGQLLVTPDKPHNPQDKIPDGDQYPDGVTNDDLNREITRTINVVDPHTGLHTTVQTAHLTRNAVVDLVTKAITYGKWNTSSWDEFDTPTVKGYTPSSAKVAKSNVDISTKNVVVDITYTANPQKGKISYIDTEGKEIGTTDLTGKTDEDVAVKPVIPHGWVIVDGQTIPNTVKATADGIPTVSIKIKHGTLQVTPDKPHNPDEKMPDGDNFPKGVSDTDLNKNVTRQIVLHEPQGDKTISQVAKYTRTATIDLVTGNVTYADWSTKHGWDEYVPETVSGYEPSIKKLDKVEKPDKDTKVEITYTALPTDNGELITPAPSIPEEPNKPTQPTTPNKDVSKKPALKQNKKKQIRKQNKKRTSGKSTSNNGKFAKRNRVNTRADGKFNDQNTGKLVNMAIAISTPSVKHVAKNSDNIATDIGSNSQSTDNLHANNTANQLPQTGLKDDKTTALAGILLASMGVAVAIGASRKKRRD